jgi:hypothetical protein
MERELVHVHVPPRKLQLGHVFLRKLGDTDHHQALDRLLLFLLVRIEPHPHVAALADAHARHVVERVFQEPQYTVRTRSSSTTTFSFGSLDFSNRKWAISGNSLTFHSLTRKEHGSRPKRSHRALRCCECLIDFLVCRRCFV